LIDEEECDYDESEELSDIDDADLLKRLEAKYGSIKDKPSDDEDEGTWTSNLMKNFKF
jgi:hypothetical protein